MKCFNAHSGYLRNRIFSNSYAKFSDDYIGSLKLSFRHINTFDTNEDVKLSDRIFSSRKTLRGFESRGVGPKDGNIYVGGNYGAAASIQSTFPNPFPDSWNAKTLVFLDNGNVWGVDYDSTIDDSNKIRSSTGIVIDFRSPIGPMSFVFAQDLSKADTDKTESFNFRLGTTF